MGVTAVSFHPTDTEMMLTGSYDESIVAWNRPAFTPLQRFKVGGGIWRIKFNPNQSYQIAVACMYDHAKIINIQTGKVLQEFKKHESIVYGIEWIDDKTAVSCSFYDHALKVWSVVEISSESER